MATKQKLNSSKLKKSLEKNKEINSPIIDNKTGDINAKFKPLSPLEDYVLPNRNGFKIESIEIDKKEAGKFMEYFKQEIPKTYPIIKVQNFSDWLSVVSLEYKNHTFYIGVFIDVNSETHQWCVKIHAYYDIENIEGTGSFIGTELFIGYDMNEIYGFIKNPPIDYIKEMFENQIIDNCGTYNNLEEL